MTTEGTTTDAGGDAHGHGDAYLYEASGISEGHGRVPKWLLGVILMLFGFWGWYVATQWSAQASTAQTRK